MSKITNDGLTRFGRGCFIAVSSRMATVGVKWLIDVYQYISIFNLFLFSLSVYSVPIAPSCCKGQD